MSTYGMKCKTVQQEDLWPSALRQLLRKTTQAKAFRKRQDVCLHSKTISFKAMIIGDESQTSHESKLLAAARAKVSEMLDLVRGLRRIV